jgi:hypothetical protein
MATLRLTRSRCPSTVAAKAQAEEDGDLLLENPNHTGGAWRPHHSDDEESGSEEESEESDEEETVEAVTDKFGNIVV